MDAAPAMLLRVEDLHKSFEGHHVLKGVSLEVPEGEIVALLGPNGAGKSTTLKAISGLLQTEDGEVTRGNVTFMGEEIANLAPENIVRRGIFQVMEGRRIIADMTCLENLRLGAFTRSDGAGVKRDIEMVYGYFPRLKERTGLAGYLSGGEQQMLAIGRALMASPEVLLLDEPSLGLAPLIIRDIFDIIDRLRHAGNTILIVEQNAFQTLKIADYAYVLELGRVSMQGKASELIHNDALVEAYLGGQRA